MFKLRSIKNEQDAIERINQQYQPFSELIDSQMAAECVERCQRPAKMMKLNVQ